MALLHAFARVAPKQVAAVATFDHGTGPAATRAADLVARVATRLGFHVVMGGGWDASAGKRASEAEWREDRRRFLADVAARAGTGGKRGGVIVTAHTRDDQVETVLMRVLRDSGARGLAALYATSEIVRPLLDCSRAEVAAYARGVGAEWIEDPSNESMRFLRNRVRRDLLPALTRWNPTLEGRLLQVAREAAGWRGQVDAYAARIARVDADQRIVSVAVADVAAYSRAELAVLWPAIAARIGLAMDWRGTERAAAFTNESRVGGRIPLAGGWELARIYDHFELGRGRAVPREEAPGRLTPGTRWDGWKFVATQEADPVSDAWVAQLPANVALSVRRWQPGDRMRLGDGLGDGLGGGGAGGAGGAGDAGGGGTFRKVKRFLSDARVSGTRRGQWPVVLAGDEIVWIPGVRRSDAAAVRPGRPGVLYRCELDDR
jgi:tRNA(Ile)-lysidine synthase